MFLSFCTIIPFFISYVFFLTFVVYCKNVPIGPPPSPPRWETGLGKEIGLGGRDDQVGEVKRVKTGFEKASNGFIQMTRLSTFCWQGFPCTIVTATKV